MSLGTERDAKGEKRDFFAGYCKTARFDVTDALRAGNNQFTPMRSISTAAAARPWSCAVLTGNCGS